MKKILFCTLIAHALLLTACEKTFEYDPSEIPGDFTALPAPAAGEGHQIHVPAFPVPAHFEREWFMRMAVGNTEDIYVTQFESKCRPGTHHMVAYGYEDENAPDNPEIGVMRDQNRPDGRPNFRGNMVGTINYFTAQTEHTTLQLPAGMAVHIPANATVDMNSHYFNATDETRFGEVYLNFNTVPVSEVQTILETELLDNSSVLVLPPQQRTTITYTKTFDEAMTIYMLTSHMHKRGELFQVYYVGGPRDGELLLTANDYKHPPTVFPTVPLAIEPGHGLRSVVTYNNDTNREIRFGVTSEDEMGIAFYLYSKN